MTTYTVNNIEQEKRVYCGREFEHDLTTGTRYNYIYVGDMPIAVYIQNDSNTMYTLHTDYIGSIEKISDKNGNVVDSMSYTPFGSRRLYSDWGKTDTATHFTDRGFTGQQHLDNFALINFNGRMYDPVLAHFLSPDPYIQSPENPLNYNRYSYCLFSPLQYVDPTGLLIGDYYDEFGLFLGSDGINDYRIYQTTRAAWNKHVTYSTAPDFSGAAGLVQSKYDNLKADYRTYYLGKTNEFGLLQLTNMGNPNILNHDGAEDTYFYTTKSGENSPIGQHGDDWTAPSVAAAFNYAVNQTGVTVVVNDVSAYDGITNLGHKSHRNGLCIDFRYITEDGIGSSNYLNLTSSQVNLNNVFLEALHNAGFRSISGGGKINSTLTDPLIHHNHIHIDRKK